MNQVVIVKLVFLCQQKRIAFKILLAIFLVSFHLVSIAQPTSYDELKELVYTNNKDAYSVERCKLDFYYPKGSKDFVTVIWFHGGGLTAGDREIPEALKGKNIAVVGAGYRLSPKASVLEILNDAADVVKWTFDHVEKYGGSKDNIIIGGYSAGAYLALMLGLDSTYLNSRSLKTSDLLGIVSFSGQAITHFTARDEMNVPEFQPVINELAPLYWVRKDAPPILLVTGDRDMEMMGRYEENAYLLRMLKLVGHSTSVLYELEGYDHSMTFPAYPILLKTINRWTK